MALVQTVQINKPDYREQILGKGRENSISLNSNPNSKASTLPAPKTKPCPYCEWTKAQGFCYYRKQWKKGVGKK